MPTCELCGYNHTDQKTYENHPCPKRGSTWKGNPPEPKKNKLLNGAKDTAKKVVSEVKKWGKIGAPGSKERKDWMKKITKKRGDKKT